MRVELVYAPGCNTYRKARSTLEMVIAEERLPIPVECIEEAGQVNGSPTIRVDGEIAESNKGNHIEALRELVCRKWKEITESPLLGI